ncbi:hypothetical protein HYV87_03305 [Candidatus Woesearchaeota archaeon]|nr:hypothetical protein [Candidatus Woesearchaeota archaeon]
MVKLSISSPGILYNSEDDTYSPYDFVPEDEQETLPGFRAEYSPLEQIAEDERITLTAPDDMFF